MCVCNTSSGQISFDSDGMVGVNASLSLLNEYSTTTSDSVLLTQLYVSNILQNEDRRERERERERDLGGRRQAQSLISNMLYNMLYNCSAGGAAHRLYYLN